jgi:hypothetical protein
MTESGEPRCFTYWNTTDLQAISGFIANWSAQIPGFQVVTDDFVELTISKHRPDFLPYYEAIRIPACRADIARLFVLLERGGIYVDAHCGMNTDAFHAMLGGAAIHGRLTLLNRVWGTDRPLDHLWPLNSFLAAAPGNPMIARLIERAIKNLLNHHAAETVGDFVAYNIWSLTGPGLYGTELLTPDLKQIKAEYSGQLKLIDEGSDAPVTRYMFYEYRKPEMHWSERQQREFLFDIPTSSQP